MEQKIVDIPLAAMRSEPSDRAEMVSQLLFGEKVEVIDRQEQWLLVKCEHDGYQGWADEKGFRFADEVTGSIYVVISPVAEFTNEKGEGLHLALGSKGASQDGKSIMYRNHVWTLSTGNMAMANRVFSLKEMLRFGMQLLHAPYLWGGRSVLGVDCSGLTQVLFALGGVQIPRDASQQVELGEEVAFVQNLQAGDLAFFGKAEASITHVGILLDSNRILHASGEVRIDRLDQQGIYNVDQKKYTHHLRVVKRLIE